MSGLLKAYHSVPSAVDHLRLAEQAGGLEIPIRAIALLLPGPLFDGGGTQCTQGRAGWWATSASPSAGAGGERVCMCVCVRGGLKPTTGMRRKQKALSFIKAPGEVVVGGVV